MPESEFPTVWDDLPEDEVDRRLESVGLVLCKSDQVIICISCGYALQPSGQTVSKHLWEKHSTSAKDRVGLKGFVCRLALPDPNTIAKRSDHSLAHPYLLVQSGFSCSKCEYHTTSQILLKRHLSQVHRQKIFHLDANDSQCWSEVKLQSWTQNGKRQFWTVRAQEQEDARQVQHQQSPRRKRKWSQVYQAEEERAALQGRGLREGTPHDAMLSSNWMRRTGWAKMFSNVDLRLLFNMAQSPVRVRANRTLLGTLGAKEVVSQLADESKLQTVGIAIDRFFDRCEDTLHHTDHSLLCWLRSQYPGKAYKSPFELPGRNATRTRYRGLWKRMVFFCLRAYLIRVRNTGEPDLELPFSPEAWRTVREVWYAVSTNDSTKSPMTATENEMDTEDMPESEYDSEESDDEYAQSSDDDFPDDSPQRPNSCKDPESGTNSISVQPHAGRMPASEPSTAISMPNDPILTSVARFCAFICTEPFHDGKSSDTIMVYFAGVLGIVQDGFSFERPRNYTSKLSAIIHSARLCLLEATLPRFPHPDLGWGPRPRLGQDKILNKMREEFICQGSPAPLTELLSLRAYGRVLARTDGAAFRVDWAEDGTAVKWEDGSLTMTGFRGLGHRALSQVEEMIGSLMGEVRPSLNLSLLRDRISEQSHGYSFLYDTRNEISSLYMKLARESCARPEHGLMTRNGWNMRSVRQFLRREELLLEQIMLMMFLRGGQAARATEFFSLRCRNGASTSRGIYVHEGSMMFVTRHSKARKSTNREFQVARYLPESDSLVLATYLVYIRPVADMIHRSSFGSENERKWLFCSYDEPDKHWPGIRLTNALKRLTRDVAGVQIGVRVYRQLSIAVTEKHLAHISSPFDRHQDRAGDAHIGVAFAWQSGHRPIQRGTSYGIDAAFPDSLQPALLRVYKWASREWHCFLNTDCERRDNSPKSTSALRYPQPEQTSRKRQRVLSSSTIEKADHSKGVVNNAGQATLLYPTLTWINEPGGPPSTPDARTTISCPGSFDGVDHHLRTTAANQPRQISILQSPPEAGGMSTGSSISVLQGYHRNDAAQCFHYNSVHRVLICKEHGYAVASWKRHLSDYHAFSTSDAKDAGRLLENLNVVRPENAETPLPNGPPIQYLQHSRVGFHCRGTTSSVCGRLSVCRAKIAQHCRKVHGWRPDPKSSDNTNWEEVRVQSFCQTPGKQRWFVVDE